MCIRDSDRTLVKDGDEGEGKVFSDVDEAMMAYKNGIVTLHARIKVRMYKEIDGVKQHKIINATVGQLIFNEHIPQDLGFVDRSDPNKAFDLEFTKLATKKQLGIIIDRFIRCLLYTS